MKSSRAKGAYLIGFGDSVGLMAKQIVEGGFRGALYSFSGFGAPKVLEIAGKSAEGVVISAVPFDAAAPTTEKQRSLVERYQSRFGKPPSHYSAFAYDLGTVLAQAARDGGTDAKSIRSALVAMKGWSGVLGPVSFDARGEASVPLKMRRMVSGKAIPIDAGKR